MQYFKYPQPVLEDGREYAALFLVENLLVLDHEIDGLEGLHLLGGVGFDVLGEKGFDELMAEVDGFVNQLGFDLPHEVGEVGSFDGVAVEAQFIVLLVDAEELAGNRNGGQQGAIDILSVVLYEINDPFVEIGGFCNRDVEGTELYVFEFGELRKVLLCDLPPQFSGQVEIDLLEYVLNGFELQ